MDAEQVLDEAEGLTRQGDLGGAERLLANTWGDMRQAPGDALHLLALIRLQQQRTDEAEPLLQSAVQKEPDSLRHRIALGHLYFSARRPAEAADAYAAALKIDRNWPGLMRMYSYVTYRSGRYAEAERAARHIISQEPTADAWTTLSSALRMQNKAKDALDAAEQGLKLEPQNTATRHARAAALVAVGKAKEGLAEVEALAGQGVEGAAIAMTRAAALDQLGRGGEAKKIQAEAIERWPDDPAVRRVTGR